MKINFKKLVELNWVLHEFYHTYSNVTGHTLTGNYASSVKITTKSVVSTTVCKKLEKKKHVPPEKVG